MHEKPRDDRGQGKHTAPPRAARKTQFKRRAATDTKRKPPEEPATSNRRSGGHLPRRPDRRGSSRTTCHKRENAPEATASAAGIQGRPRQRKPRTGQPERRRTSTTAARRTICQGRPPRRAEAEPRRRSGRTTEAATRSARTYAEPRQHPRQGKTTSRGRGGKKRSQSSATAAPEEPATQDAPERAGSPPQDAQTEGGATHERYCNYRQFAAFT